MDILSDMDRLLAAAEAQGREAQHWIVRQEDWRAIGELLRAGMISDPATVSHNAYRGVPVHFGEATPNQIVGLVDRTGEAIL